MSKSAIFIDATLPDYQTLVAAVAQDVEVFLVQTGESGLASMAAWAETHTGYDRIAIVGHGADGLQRLGTDRLDSSALTDSAKQALLQKVGASLTAEGDLLLYGCDVANGETGEAFVDQLATLTGADVAASTDITGNSGDWTLEYSAGDIEIHGAFNYASLDAYQHDLTVTGWDRGAATYYLQVDATGNIGVGFSGGMWTITNDGNLLGGNWEAVRWTFTAYYTPLGGSMSILYGINTYYSTVTQSASGNGVGSFSATVGGPAFLAAPGSTVQIASLQAVNDRTGGPSLYLDQSVGLIDRVPRFVDTSGNTVTAQTITVPVNATNFNLRPYLKAEDGDGQNLTWNVYQPGSHGTATVSGSTTAGGGGALPAASGTYTYTPTANYSGQDTIKISVNDGIATVVKTFTINMNDPPVVTGAGSTTAFTEQTPVVIAPAIEISDTADTEWDGGKLVVTVTANADATDTLSLPGANPGGSGIWLDGTNVMAGSTLIGTASAAQGTGSTAWTLTFNASATSALVQAVGRAVIFHDTTDAPGSTDRTVTFQAIDKNGGDGTSATQTISVAPVNDAPIGTPTTKTTNEDTAYTFAAADFGFTDPDLTTGSNNTLQAVEITTLPASGSVKFSGNPISAGASIPVASITSGLLTWAPANNAFGTAQTSLTFKVSDGALFDTTARTLTFDVTAIADTPSITDAQTRPNTQTSSGLVVSRNAADGAEVTWFKVTGITNGTLYLADGTTQIVNTTFISYAEASAGLKFTPTNGSVLPGSVTIQAATSATDGALGGSPVTATILVNEPPTSSNDSATTLEDTAIVLASTDFGTYADTDTPADPFTSVKITTTPATGSLQYDSTGSGTWTTVVQDQVITVVDIGSNRLRFTPGTDLNGAGQASLGFKVYDGFSFSNSAYTLTFNVTAVSDAPAGTNATISLAEDGTHALTAANFGFTDPKDATSSTANTLTNVKITTLPAAGALTLTGGPNGGVVTAGDVVSKADIDAGKLLYTPVAHANATGYASFTFQVQDDGSTANGGVAEDASPNTITFDVTPVNDAPVLSGTGADMTGIDENATNDAGQTVASILANVADTDTTIGSAVHGSTNGLLTGVAIYSTTINGPSTGGKWQYKVGAGSWTDVGTVSGMQALLLKSTDMLRFVPDGKNGQTASFNYYAWDQSGATTAGTKVDVSTRDGTTPYSQASDSVAITVSDVNDAPTIAKPAAQTVNEDGSLGITGISFDDVDINTTWRADSDTTNDGMSATLSVSHGTLTLAGTTGITVTAGADASATMTIAGSRDAINTAVATLTYAPGTNYSGSDTLNIDISDTGNVGTGGTLTASDTVAITVTPVNDAPVLVDGVPLLTAIDENKTTANTAGNLVSDLLAGTAGGSNAGDKTGRTDVDTLNNGGLGNAPEAVGQGVAVHAVSNDGPADGGTWQYTIDGGTNWTNIGAVSSSSALLLSATDKVRFVPDADNGATATLSYYAWDGATGTHGNKVDPGARGGSTAFSLGSDTASITVTAVNDAPTLDLDANNSSTAAGNNYKTTFLPRGSEVTVVDSDIAIADVDQTQNPNTNPVHAGQDRISQAVITLSAGADDNYPGQTDETLTFKDSGVATTTWNGLTISGNGSTAVTITGVSTWATYQSALQKVVYNNANLNPTTGDRTVTVVVTDNDDTDTAASHTNKLASRTATTTISVTGVAVVDMNGNTTGANHSVTYTEGGSGTMLSTTDGRIDNLGGTNLKTVVLTLSNPQDGTAGNAESLFVDAATITSLFNTRGITVTGSGSDTVTLAATNVGVGVTANNMNVALRAVLYKNISDAPSVTLRVVNVTVEDLTRTGVGATSTVTIIPVNDAPVISVNTAHTVLEGGLLTLSTTNLNATDVDDAQASLEFIVTTAPTKGVLFRDGNGNGAADSGEVLAAAAASGVITSFTQADLAAGIVKYRQTDTLTGPATDFGSDSFSFKVQDGMENGVTAPTGTASLTITPVNDAPALSATGGSPTFNENPGTVVTLFSGASASTVETVQTVTQLTLTVAGVADGAAEILRIDGQGIPLGTAASTGVGGTLAGLNYAIALVSGTATVTLTHAGLTTTQLQGLIDGLAYQNTSNAPTGTSRVVTLTSIKDNGGTVNGGVDTTTVSITSTVTVVAEDTAPVLVTNAGKTVSNGALVTISTGDLNTTDTDTVTSALTYTVGSAPLKGTLFKDANSSGTVESGEALNATGTFTQADLAAGKIKYRHDGADNLADSFAFTVKDATTTLASANFTLSINAVTPTTPTVTGGGNTGGNSTDGSDVLFSGVVIAPPTGETVKSIQFTLIGVRDGNKEFVTLNGQAVAMTAGTTTVGDITYVVVANGGGTFTVTMTDTTSPGWSGPDASAIINGARYKNTEVPPTSGVRTATLDSVTDYLVGGGTGTPAPLSITSTITVATSTDLWTLAQAQTAVPTPTAPNDKIQKLNFTVTGAADGSDEVMKINGHEIAMTAGTTTLDGVVYTVTAGGSAGTFTIAVSKDACWTEAEAEALLDGATYVNNKLPMTTGSRVVTLDSVVEADSSVPLVPSGNPTPAPGPTNAGSPGNSSTVSSALDLWTLAEAQTAVPAPSGIYDHIKTLNFTVTGALDGASEVIKINGQDVSLVAGTTTVGSVTYTVVDNGGGNFSLEVTNSAATPWTEAEAEALLDGATYINNAATRTAGNRSVSLTNVVEYDVDTAAPNGTPTPGVNPEATKDVPTTGGPLNYPSPQTGTPLSGSSLTVTPGSSVDALTFTVDGVKDGNLETLTVDGIVIPLVPTAAGTLKTGTTGIKFTVTVTVDAAGKATVLIDTPDAPDADAINYTEAQARTVVQTVIYTNNALPATGGPRVVDLTKVKEETGTGSPAGGTSEPAPVPPITGTKDVTGAPSHDPFTSPGDNLPDLDGDGNPNDTDVTVDSITIGVTGIKDGVNEIININGQAIPLVAGTQTINGYSYTVTIDGNGNATVVLGTPNPTANFTEAEANAVIDGISYTNKANPPTPGARDISVNGIVKVTAGAPPVETPVPTPGINESIPVGTVTNTAPTVDTNATVNVAEGQTVTLSSSHVAASDAQQAAGSLVFKLLEAPANGAVFRDSNANGLVNAGETIALNGTFTQQEMLNGTIKYRHNGSETASDLLKFTVSDGIATTTAMQQVFAVSRTNDQPALTATTATPSFTEGGAAAALFSAATATTGDTLGTAQKFLTLVLTVSNLRDGSDETLLVNGANSIELSGATASGTAGMVNGSNLSYTVAKSGTTATVTLTHAGLTEAELKAVVESLQYENTSSNPTAGARGVTLTQLQDDGGTASGGIDTSPLAMTSTVTVAAANNAPTLVGTGFTVVEGSSFTLSTTQLAAADSDSALGSLVYTVTTAPAAGLLYLDNNGNSVNDSGDTTLALNSTFTQAELTSGKVRYQHDGSENADPNLAFSVSDGSAASSAQTVAVTRTAANDAPTLGNLDGDTITYPPANAAMLIDKDGNATVVDPDSTDFSGGTLRASIFFNGDPVKDVLSIKDIGTGAGQIGISTNNVSYAGTTIGTFTGGSSGADLVVTLNVNATPTAVSALISALQFYNSDTAPVNNSRGIRISLSDGDGGTSLASQVQVNIPVGGPAFLSGSGFYVSENTSLVTVMAASDAPAKMPITFGISPTVGGSNVDAAKFTINSSDGTLSFISAPDYESPTDSGGDNTYNVVVRANNSEGAYTEAALAVHVVDIANESTGATPGDTSGPVFGFATVNGNTLTMTYTDASNLDATNLPAIGAFAVTNGGVANPVTAVAINASNKTVALTLTSAVNAGQVVTVAYTDPTSGNDTSAIQDAAGNDAPSIASIGVTNLTASSGGGTTGGGTTGGGTTGGGTTGGGTTGGGTTADTSGPNFSSAIVSGNSLVISLADNSNLDAANLPSTNAFTVLANGVSVPVQSITINATSKTVSLILQNNVLAGQSVTVSYSDPTASNDTAAIQDSLGNDMASLSAQTVVNLSSNSGPANSLPTGNVLIVGTLAEGQVLSALNTLADANGMGVVTYNWFAGGSLIGSGNTRTLGAAEVGKTITVSASYIDGLGTQETVSSLPTGVVSTAITPNRLPTGSVLISGTPLIGQQLVAGNTLADADGMGTVTYQWLANGVVVATGTSLTLSSNLLGSVISVRASYIDGAGKSETVTSVATSPVTGAPDAEIDIVDGSIVETVSNSSPSGLVTTIQAVAPITSTRQEDTSTTHDALADIPLAMDGNGIPLIQVGLPVGIGLAAEALSGGNLSLRQQLVNATNPRVSNDSTFAAIANDGIDRFVESVTDASQVTVRTITLNTAANVSTAPNQPIVITGATGTGENDAAHPARQEALVIDARNLPSGTVLTFNQVEFAIVIGAARIVGGDGSNFVVGDDAAQFIVLGADDDLLHGGDGDDVVGSKTGNDELHGDGGSDYLVGGLGDDRLDGGSGNDLLQGGQSDAGTWAFDMDQNGNINGYFTAAVPELSESATMEVTAWRTGSGEPITSDERFAFSYQSGALVRDVALLYHAATGELPSVNELNLYSLSSMSSLQLGDLAYNYLVSHLPQLQSVEAQVNQLIELVWGHSDSALTAEGVQFINGGGTWAEGLLYLARHAEHANLLNDASGNLKLASDWVLSETGWSSDLGNDLLWGGEGNDVLVGGGGNNVIDGGAGFDLAVFMGTVSDYLLQRDNQGQLLLIHRASQASNTLVNIEMAQFGNMVVVGNGSPEPIPSSSAVDLANFVVAASQDQIALIGVADWVIQ